MPIKKIYSNQVRSGCRPSSNTCPNAGGQDAINGANWCTSGGYPTVSVTYDVAGTGYIDVQSSKFVPLILVDNVTWPYLIML